jgi:hypothetical protein
MNRMVDLTSGLLDLLPVRLDGHLTTMMRKPKRRA